MPNSIVAVQVCDPQQYCWSTAQQLMIVIIQPATKILNQKSQIINSLYHKFSFRRLLNMLHRYPRCTFHQLKTTFS